MTNKQKAIKYIRELDLEKYVEKNFKKGKLMKSCGGLGILFFADEYQMQKAAEIEKHYSDGHAVVWHIVEDSFTFPDREMNCVAYLTVTDSVPDGLMVFDVDGKKVYTTYAYIDNLTVPKYSEFGETQIAQCAGGVIRK